MLREINIAVKRRLLTAAGGIHSGKSQEVDHTKALRRAVMRR